MLEQDIELARLLVSKLEELEVLSQELHAELREAKAALDAAEATRTERASYLDVLSRAAELLERTDLTVDSPETAELEERVAGIKGRLDQINDEAGSFRELMSDLAQRAPRLLAAARGDELPADPEDNGSEPGPAPTGEAPAEADIVESFPPAVEVSGVDEILRRFNVNNLKTKEVFTYGRGVAYIIDTHSILDRVPAYDRNLRQLDEHQMRDELIRDFDTIQRELNGTIYMVFDSWYQSQQAYGNEISLEFATGADEGTLDGISRKIEELTKRFIAEDRNVCIFTGNSELGEELKNAGAYVLSLGEVFMA